MVGALVVVIGGFLLYVQIDGIPHYFVEKVTFRADPTPERIERGRKLSNVLCATCHMDPSTRQLTGHHMGDAPEQFGVLYAPNITRHPTKGIGGWTDSELAYLLRTGVRRDGRYTPPYMAKLPHLSDEDLASMHRLPPLGRPDGGRLGPQSARRNQPSFLTKVLCHTVFKKLPYPDKPSPRLRSAIASRTGATWSSPSSATRVTPPTSRP